LAPRKTKRVIRPSRNRTSSLTPAPMEARKPS
jgi:hypothetical protein